MDRGKNAAAEKEAGEDKNGNGVGGDDMGEFERQQAARDEGRDPCPDRNGGVVVSRTRLSTRLRTT
jgi:hypothetical protein